MAAPPRAGAAVRGAARPRVRIRRQAVGPQPFKHETEGAIVYTGTRHDRPVSVRIAGGSTVTVGGPVREFDVQLKGERLLAAAGAPREVEAVIAPLRASSHWKGVRFSGGPAGVVAERSSGGGEHWMRDLWLAERLADAARRS